MLDNRSLRERSNTSILPIWTPHICSLRPGCVNPHFGLYPNQITASGSSRPFPAPNRKHLSLCDTTFLWKAKHLLHQMATWTQNAPSVFCHSLSQEPSLLCHSVPGWNKNLCLWAPTVSPVTCKWMFHCDNLSFCKSYIYMLRKLEWNVSESFAVFWTVWGN